MLWVVLIQQEAHLIGEGKPASVNTIGFVTIASTGNASDFGDLIESYFLGSSEHVMDMEG